MAFEGGPERRDFTGSKALMRGNTWPLIDDAVTFDPDVVGRHLRTPGAVVRCTIKRYENLDDEHALWQGDSLTGGIIILSDTSLRIVVPRDYTDNFPITTLYYDVTIDFSPVDSEDIWYGDIACIADVTRQHL